ncbi:hypothetical protein ARMGADRAFT_1037210 [Armillaria gallica]|uniref:Uncharacterized protein n=1 Tax=Armillaria gallica TaxID=47427 RepID=A0A2H3CMM7_ARMGA|nr:hypothetical protein ARMGADRAFT_1037210 [Armillaria gallica]
MSKNRIVAMTSKKGGCQVKSNITVSTKPLLFPQHIIVTKYTNKIGICQITWLQRNNRESTTHYSNKLGLGWAPTSRSSVSQSGCRDLSDKLQFCCGAASAILPWQIIDMDGTQYSLNATMIRSQETIQGQVQAFSQQLEMARRPFMQEYVLCYEILRKQGKITTFIQLLREGEKTILCHKVTISKKGIVAMTSKKMGWLHLPCHKWPLSYHAGQHIIGVTGS